MFLEGSREIGLVVEPHSEGSLGDVDLSLADESGGLLEPEVADELTSRHTGDLLHLAVQLGAAEPHLAGQHVDPEVGILNIVVDGAHHTFHERIVIALHLHVLHFVGLDESTRELPPEPTDVLHEVVDEHMQFLHIEGLAI